MEVVTRFDRLVQDRNSVVTVGSFDGVHLAHREILRELVHRSRMREGRSVVVTFDPHPSEVVRAGRTPVPLLTTLQERVEILRDLNVDLVVVVEFTPAFSMLSSREFYKQYVVDRIGVGEVVVGYDHMFGHNREAGVRDLISMGKEFHFSVFAAQEYAVDGVTVGSSEIRRSLLAGNVEHASMLLGYPYRLDGAVVKGDGRGKSLGYPTANIVPATRRKLVPGRGVYLVGIDLDTESWFGMMNIGRRPTFGDQDQDTLEVNIFALENDVYGAHVTITFLKRLRDEMRFSSPDELATQLGKDKEASLQFLSDLRKQN